MHYHGVVAFELPNLSQCHALRESYETRQRTTRATQRRRARAWRDEKQRQSQDKDQQEQGQRHKRETISLGVSLAASAAAMSEDARIGRHQQVCFSHSYRTP